jgi:predicted MFS family arabinose efflux permease
MTERVASRVSVRLSQSGRLLFGIALFWMGLYLYVPILAPEVTRLTGSAGLAGLVVATYGLPQLLTRMTLASWADRLGRRRPFLVGGLILVALSSLGMALLPTGPGFLVFRTVAGLAASTWAMFSIQYVSYQPPDRVARAMGWVSFANNAGQVAAVLLGGVLAARFGGAAPFWVSVAVAGMGLLLVAPVPEPQGPARDVQAITSWRQIVRQRDVVVAAILGIVFQGGTFVTTFGYVPLWAAEHHLPAADLGVLTAVSLVPGALTPIVAGSWAARRWPLEALLAGGFLIIAVFTGVTPATGAGIGLFVAQALTGVGRGLVAPILMTLAVRKIASQQRTTALATYQALYAAGMVAGPALAAALVQQIGLGNVFVLTGLLSAAGGAFSAWLLVTALRARPGVAREA